LHELVALDAKWIEMGLATKTSAFIVGVLAFAADAAGVDFGVAAERVASRAAAEDSADVRRPEGFQRAAVVGIKLGLALTEFVGGPVVTLAALNVVEARAEWVALVGVEVGRLIAAEFVSVARAMLVGAPVVQRAALEIRVARAQRVVSPAVLGAALLKRIAHAEFVRQVMITWAALVARVALAEVWVGNVRVEERIIAAALHGGIAWAQLVVGERIARAAVDFRVALAGVVVDPGLSWAAEIVRLHAVDVIAGGREGAAID